MGRTIGLSLAEKGHQVFFGSRNQHNIDYIQQFSKTPILYGSLSEAVEYGEVLLYNLRYVLPSTIAAPDIWVGKILIDCNNGIIPEDFRFDPVIRSFAEQFQQDVPGAFVVKAFNCSAQEIYNHDDSTLKAHNVLSFIAGDNEGAKEKVSALIREIGLTPVDIGSIVQARLLESFADLVRLLMINNGFGPYLTFSAQVLPPVETKFGIRQPTNYK